MPQQADQHQPESAPATLGGVLYPDKSKPLVAEADWVRLVRCVAAGDQLALHALYERTHRLVFTLTMRITRNRETAEELTVDVFYDVWRRAPAYDPDNGTVIGWIMNQARSRAIDRLRFDQRHKRTAPPGEQQPAHEAGESVDRAERAELHDVLRRALTDLSLGERQAINAAFFGELSYAEVALRLNQPLGTVKTRIRSALQKLRQALAAEGVQR